jgi:steroid delta-isomerase-like uncharacterized protein
MRNVVARVPPAGLEPEPRTQRRGADRIAVMTDSELRARREALVREHMQSENVHEFDVTIGTFGHPRYEIIPTGEIYDGEAEVRRYFEESRAAFPDQRNELVTLRHSDDAVIVEFDLKGTHQGPLRGIPPTGREFTCRTLAMFIFDHDQLVCERVYFDALTILAQLGLAGALPAAS